MTDSNATVHDPVCHTNIDIRDSAGRSDYEGLTYYFCTSACKLDFDTDPERVLESEAEFDHESAAHRNDPGYRRNSGG